MLNGRLVSDLLIESPENFNPCHKGGIMDRLQVKKSVIGMVVVGAVIFGATQAEARVGNRRIQEIRQDASLLKGEVDRALRDVELSRVRGHRARLAVRDLVRVKNATDRYEQVTFQYRVTLRQLRAEFSAVQSATAYAQNGFRVLKNQVREPYRLDRILGRVSQIQHQLNGRGGGAVIPVPVLRIDIGTVLRLADQLERSGSGLRREVERAVRFEPISIAHRALGAARGLERTAENLERQLRIHRHSLRVVQDLVLRAVESIRRDLRVIRLHTSGYAVDRDLADVQRLVTGLEREVQVRRGVRRGPFHDIRLR